MRTAGLVLTVLAVGMGPIRCATETLAVEQGGSGGMVTKKIEPLGTIGINVEPNGPITFVVSYGITVVPKATIKSFTLVAVTARDANGVDFNPVPTASSVTHDKPHSKARADSYSLDLVEHPAPITIRATMFGEATSASGSASGHVTKEFIFR